METKAPGRSVFLAFAITVLIAGNNAIAVRYSNAELPPFFGAAVRFAFAALIFMLIMILFRLPLPRGRGFLGAILFGMIGTGINYALLYWALETLHPALSMIILALAPLLTFLLACIHGQEVFRWKALVGALIALGGIGVIISNQLGTAAPLLPMLAVAGGAVCFAESSIIIKAFPQSHPITTNAIALTAGSLVLFLLSALTKETPRMPTLPTTWGALIFLVLLGSVTVYALTVYVIKNWTASASSYQFVLFPIVTIAVSAWLTKEPITITELIGALLVLAGVYIGGIAKAFKITKINPAVLASNEEACQDC